MEHACSDNFSRAKNSTSVNSSLKMILSPTIIVANLASINDPKEVWNVIPCRIGYHCYFLCNWQDMQIYKHFILLAKKLHSIYILETLSRTTCGWIVRWFSKTSRLTLIEIRILYIIGSKEKFAHFKKIANEKVKFLIILLINIINY